MDEEGYRYTDKIQFYVMDLKAISDASEEEQNRGLVEWAEAFNARDWDQLQKINNPGVKEAAKEMEAVMSSPEKRQFVWNRRLAQLDYNSQIGSAKQEGFVEALAGLVKDGLIPITEAAKRANLTVAEFSKQAGISTAQ